MKDQHLQCLRIHTSVLGQYLFHKIEKLFQLAQHLFNCRHKIECFTNLWMWEHWLTSKMVPITSNFECKPIKSMVLANKTYIVLVWCLQRIYTYSIIPWYFLQQTQCTRSKCPIDRLSKNHQRLYWEREWKNSKSK